MIELVITCAILFCVFIGMGKECSGCGAEMNIFGRLRGAGGVHRDDCIYRKENYRE